MTAQSVSSGLRMHKEKCDKASSKADLSGSGLDPFQ